MHVCHNQRELVLSNKGIDTDSLSPCDHEEGDTKIFVHLKHAVIEGHKKAFIRTVDTDIVVIAISVFNRLQVFGLEELWVGFGTGRHRRDIPIHQVCQELGPDKCLALPFFHAFSGSDFTAFFRGIGKKTSWNTWKAMPEMTEVFIKITNEPNTVSLDSDLMTSIQRFVCMLYSKTGDVHLVNDARKILFTQSLRSPENVPPTLSALFQKVKRTILVATFMWNQCLARSQNLPSPQLWWWEWNSRLSI